MSYRPTPKGAKSIHTDMWLDTIENNLREAVFMGFDTKTITQLMLNIGYRQEAIDELLEKLAKERDTNDKTQS